MKSAEEMMLDYIQSQLDENQTFTINSEQYLKIWNWYQEVELAMEKQKEYAYNYYARNERFPCMIMPLEDNMTKYNKRTDENHAMIRDGLRQAGYVVKDLSRCGEGVPDLLIRGGGRVVMLEIKQGSAKLTDAEKEFHEMFHGLGCYIVRTLEDAIRIMERERI